MSVEALWETAKGEITLRNARPAAKRRSASLARRASRRWRNNTNLPDIFVETLAELVELSPFHFSRVFKQTTGMSPLQFVTRERIARAQQLIRETPRSLIEIALEVGYTS